MMTGELTDAEVATQIERGSLRCRFSRFGRGDATRYGQPLRRRSPSRASADSGTLDAVPLLSRCNLSNLDAALHGNLLDLIKVNPMCVGGGPTLDYPDAAAFLAGFDPLIEKARTRMLQLLPSPGFHCARRSGSRYP
jgi:hypothetical protein